MLSDTLDLPDLTLLVSTFAGTEFSGLRVTGRGSIDLGSIDLDSIDLEFETGVDSASAML